MDINDFMEDIEQLVVDNFGELTDQAQVDFLLKNGATQEQIERINRILGDIAAQKDRLRTKKRKSDAANTLLAELVSLDAAIDAVLGPGTSVFQHKNV